MSAVMVAAFALCGCVGLTATDRGPRGDPVARLAPTTPPPWREDFGDPVLRDLLKQTDAGALDTKVALAHLRRADGEVEAADAVRNVNVIAGVASAVGGRNFHSAGSAASPTLEISNEVDVWGRLAKARDAARSEDRAATEDVASARLMVGAQTARTYLVLRAAQQAEAVATRRLRLSEQALELASARIALGVSTRLDIDPRRAAVVATADLAQKARDEAGLQSARLTDLTGHAGQIAPTVVALVLGPPTATISSAIVDARPDVQAAQARLTAADQHRASAIAATRPQFQIAAAFGAPDAAIATLLDVRALAWAVAATVSHEILDGGARRAKVHIATAEADLADLAYRQTVLTGWSEVRDAMVADAQARRALAAAETGLALTRITLDIGEARHAAGATDGLALVALRDAVEQAELTTATARLQVALARVQLALATGGG